MARRPNYGFEKRQKEIDKQKKKEAKAEKKRLRKEEGGDGDQDATVEEAGGSESPLGDEHPGAA